jgi:dihydrofolate reductase
MGKLIYEMSASVDGFVSGANVRPEAGLGDGGEQLHQWASGEDEVSNKLVQDELDAVGAVIVGRTTYDLSVPYWGADGPIGPTRVPTFVVTHAAPPSSPANGVYTFVTDGIESAVAQAKAAAGEKDVSMSGADVAQQCLRAGLVDEVVIHLVPVLFGSGTPMFGHLGSEHVQLEAIQAIHTNMVTHLRFRVVK